MILTSSVDGSRICDATVTLESGTSTWNVDRGSWMGGCAYVFAGSVAAGIYEVDAVRVGLVGAKQTGISLPEVDQTTCAAVTTTTVMMSTSPGVAM